jgi:transglutaminase-like putative cysteine protease
VEINAPKSDSVTATARFTVRRESIFQTLDGLTAAPLSAAQKQYFAEELRVDAPHMEVTADICKIANEACASVTDPAGQTRALLEYVTAHADHYSKDPSKPKCGIGDAKNCLAQGGGCCTDMHSLFIALARACGIPARLQMGYRLQAKNEGVEADPGYRCWPEYFIAGSGWVPADLVEADAAEGQERVRWLSGLSERRIHLNEGRDFDLPEKRHAERVNTMTIGYAEIDDVPARVMPEGDKQPQLTRTVFYQERTSGPR